MAQCAPAIQVTQLNQKEVTMGQKYRQAGYKDSERKERSGQKGTPGGRRPKSDGPKGRGLGKPSRTASRCARCGADQDLSKDVALDAVCVGCGSDLHACTNCSYFDSSAPNECRQPIVHRIARKSSRNTCEIFASKTTQEIESDRGGSEDPKNDFDALFDI